MGITKFYAEMINDFYLYGRGNNKYLPFEIGKEYDGFLVGRKFIELAIMKNEIKYKTEPGNAPIVTLDPSLEKEKDKIYFPEKLEKANEMLKTTKLPKLKNPG